MCRTRLVWPICCVVLAISAAPASAVTRYASPTGSGTPPCAQTAPCSLENAVNNVAQNGDDVEVAPGNYTLASFLLIDNSITVHGRAGEPRPVITQATHNGTAVSIQNGVGAVLRDLRINHTATGTGNAVRTVGFPTQATLDRVSIEYSGTSLGVVANPDSTLTLHNSSVFGSATTGRLLVVAEAGLELVNATVRATGSVPALFVDGGGGGFARADIRNSILKGGAEDIEVQIGTFANTVINIDHSNFSLISPAGATVNQGPGNQTPLPVFVNEAGGDLRQAAGSPTIDAGVADSRGALDFEREGRDSAPDIGADERHVLTPGTRYAGPNAIGTGECATPLAACSLEHAVETVAQPNDEVVLAPGNYTLDDTLDVNKLLDVHGPLGGPRPVISGTFAGEMVHLGGGQGSSLKDVEVRQNALNSRTVQSQGNGVVIERVVAVAQGGNSVAIGLNTGPTTGDQLLNSVAWAPPANSAAVEAHGDDDKQTDIRNVTAVAGGLGVVFKVDGPGGAEEVLSVRNAVMSGGGVDLLTDVSGGNPSRVVVGNSNFDSHLIQGAFDNVGQQTAPPQFVNAAAGDFHQAAGSPTIDAGFFQGQNGSNDFDGDSRRLGTTTDIGADEFRALPVVTTGAATGVGETGATLNGTADPERLPTTVRFEYGSDTSYGSQTAPQAVGDGADPTGFSAPVGGLSPGTTYHYRAVATNAGGTSVGPDMTFTTASAPVAELPGAGLPPGTGPGPGDTVQDLLAPTVNSFNATRRRFRRGTPAPLRRAAAPRGTHFRYALSEPARATITIERKTTGRRVGRRCVRQTARNRTRRKCTRYVRAGVLTQAGQTGANALAFSGRIGRRNLALGSYRATLVATDAANNASRPRRLTFKIVRR